MISLDTITLSRLTLGISTYTFSTEVSDKRSFNLSFNEDAVLTSKLGSSTEEAGSLPLKSLSISLFPLSKGALLSESEREASVSPVLSESLVPVDTLSFPEPSSMLLSD